MAIASGSKSYQITKNVKHSFQTTSVSYLLNIFSSWNTYRHMLLLSIPSIFLLIYQSCLVKLKPHYIFGGGLMRMCWFMSFQMIH